MVDAECPIYSVYRSVRASAPLELKKWREIGKKICAKGEGRGHCRKYVENGMKTLFILRSLDIFIILRGGMTNPSKFRIPPKTVFLKTPPGAVTKS